MTQETIDFPEGGKEKKEIPQFPEEHGKTIEALFSALVEAVNVYSTGVTQLAVDLGMPEIIQSQSNAHRKSLDTLDVAINFHAHRALTTEIPSLWALKKMKEDEDSGSEGS